MAVSWTVEAESTKAAEPTSVTAPVDAVVVVEAPCGGTVVVATPIVSGF